MKTRNKAAIGFPPPDSVVRFAANGVSPQGVDREAGVIRGFNVIALGEARSHNMWIDEEFLSQVNDAGTKAKGLKMRFGHPGMSADALGTQVAKATNFRIEEDIVLADAEFIASAYRGPSGENRADFLMQYAEDAPEHFGTSIVFEMDRGAMLEFEGKHSDKDGNFKSPDKKNKKNYPHVRLANLMASDFTDTPAANNGLFGADDVPAIADAVLSYVTGLSETMPDQLVLGIHPDRIKAFFDGFLERNGLVVCAETELGETPEESPEREQIEQKGKEEMAAEENTQTAEAPEADPVAEIELRMKKFKQLGAVFGLPEVAEELALGELSIKEAIEVLKAKKDNLLHAKPAPQEPERDIDAGAFPSADPHIIRVDLARRAEALSKERNIAYREALLVADKEMRKEAA